MTKRKPVVAAHCPCGSQLAYAACCGRYIDQGQRAPTADILMRSRYTAFALQRESYLLATWHVSTRPHALGLAEEPPTQWIALEIRRHEPQDPHHAIVEFTARYKVNGRALHFHEISRFVCEDGQWFYVTGDMRP